MCVSHNHPDLFLFDTRFNFNGFFPGYYWSLAAAAMPSLARLTADVQRLLGAFCPEPFQLTLLSFITRIPFPLQFNYNP